MAGGGIKPGITYGETDDFGYNVVERPRPRPRPERDDPALPGHRPHTLTYFQGRDFRLTDVHGNVVKDVLA